MLTSSTSRKMLATACAALALIATANEAWATYYLSDANGTWNTGANWNPVGVPGGLTSGTRADDVDISHSIDLDANRYVDFAVVRSGGVLSLNGLNLDTYYAVDVQGSIPDAGTITGTTWGSGAIGAYAGGSIAQAYFTVNQINFWGGAGTFSMAHGTANNFGPFSDNLGEVFRVLQPAGQTDGLALSVFPTYSNTIIDLVFDGGSTAGDWALRVDGNQVGTFLTLNGAGRLTWSGAPGITVFHDADLDQTFVGIQASEAVPEPSTYVLSLIGMAGLGLVVWRRRFKRSTTLI